MSLPKHHFKLSSHRQTTFACSDEILNFFTRQALTGTIQFLCAEFFTKLFIEAKARGLVGHFDEANEQKLIALLADLNFTNSTSVVIKAGSKPKSKSTPNV